MFKLKISTYLRYALCFVTALTLSVILSACNASGDVTETTSDPSKSTYRWYDADGTLLYEETIDKAASPTEYALPEDDERWDYIEWKSTPASTERHAYRVPKSTYFVGNVFKVVIEDLCNRTIATASAFVFNEDGWFITNAHAMDGAYYGRAVFNIPNAETGEDFTSLSISEGTVYNAERDLYIGKIENYSTVSSYYKDIPIKLTHEIGESTYAMGYPMNADELNITEGNIVDRSVENVIAKDYYICTSSYVTYGNSGGILTNGDLEVIGIITLRSASGKFSQGIAIAAPYFTELLQSTSDAELVPLIERFHASEMAYIDYFNRAKALADEDVTYSMEFEDGYIAYIYDRLEDGTDSRGKEYTVRSIVGVYEDSWIEYIREISYKSGEICTVYLYGYYNYQDALCDFAYEFRYEFGGGAYYTVDCEEINYSETAALSITKCETDSYLHSITQEDMSYAKSLFNDMYEYLLEDIAKAE